MKIKLKPLFAKDYKAGYLAKNQEPRRTLSLIRYDNTRTSMSYARYLMCIKLDRYLEPHEHVDHIDDNKLHDSITNLQILTPKENQNKMISNLGKTTVPITLICPVCNKEFTKPRRNLVVKLNQGKNPTCSRTCGGIYSHKNKSII